MLEAHAMGQALQRLDHGKTGPGRGQSIISQKDLSPGLEDLHQWWRDSRGPHWMRQHDDAEVVASFCWDAGDEHRLVRGESGVFLVSHWLGLSMHAESLEYEVAAETDADVSFWPNIDDSGHLDTLAGYFLMRPIHGSHTLQLHGVDGTDNWLTHVLGSGVWDSPARPFADRAREPVEPRLAADTDHVLLAWTEVRDGRGVLFTRTVDAAGIGAISIA